MSISISYKNHICVEGEDGEIYAWGKIGNGEYGLLGGDFFGDKIGLNISNYKKAVMGRGCLYGID
jgi:hypothetical protein